MKITDDKLLGHARAILKPNMKHKWENGKVPKNETKDILDMIRQRQDPNYKKPITRPETAISADDFQRFKKIFVEEYGGEKVQESGMTHKELLRYFKDSYREGDEFDAGKKLRRFLNNLDK